MLERTAEYQAAIVAAERRIGIRASVSVIDPDLEWAEASSSGEAPWSKSSQLCDKLFEQPAAYATLEPGRWILDGSQGLIPDDPAALTGAVGFVGDVLCDAEGVFDPPVWVEERFTNVDVLQACSVFFSTSDVDGIPVDLTVEVMQGGTAVFSQEITGNVADHLAFDGFTVFDPDAIRVTVSKWSLPRRRLRIAEIVPGIYEFWDGRMLAELSIVQNGDISCMSLPYNTCQLVLDNHTKRFEPRKKDNLFQSIEERQGIGIELGVRLPDGSMEYKPRGVYYQKSPGWSTSDNGVTITWSLVDIIGLLVDRVYVVPEELPATVEGWVASVAAQLGENFADKYRVDPDCAGTAVTALDRSAVAGKTCGDILRWVCQASGTWPRAADDTGDLTVEPLWNEGGRITLRDIAEYPTMKANKDIAMLVFNLTDGVQITVAGTSSSSGETKTITNPFIHTQEQALASARMILATYGGNRLDTVGRGDPATEIGDVDTVWLDESSATTGRRVSQTFEVRDGFLQDCKTTLLQADGSFLYEECVVLTGSGEWTPPAANLRVIIGQGGQGSTAGADGVLKTESGLAKSGNYAANGSDGLAGKIWHGTIEVNAGVPIAYYCGAGSAAGAYGEDVPEGEESTFGAFSSAAGRRYSPAYTDIASGNAYGRSGVPAPLDGTSDGGAAGKGGAHGLHEKRDMVDGEGNPAGTYYKTVYKPEPGTPGVKGGDGFIVVYWDKEAVN